MNDGDGTDGRQEPAGCTMHVTGTLGSIHIEFTVSPSGTEWADPDLARLFEEEWSLDEPVVSLTPTGPRVRLSTSDGLAVVRWLEENGEEVSQEGEWPPDTRTEVPPGSVA